MLLRFTIRAIALVCLPYILQRVAASTGGRDQPEWHEAKHFWTMQQLTKPTALKLSRIVSLGRLQSNILPNILYTRTPGSSGSANARRIITIIMRDILGWTMEYDTFVGTPPVPFEKTTFSNIIATHDPSARRRLVLACHYDSKVTPRGFVGATDSAVPCSMMMELAVALRDYLARSKGDLTLQLIFFDGEEAFVRWSDSDSLYGSRHLAKLWEDTAWPRNVSHTTKNKLDSIDLLAVLDLLGAPNPRFYNTHSVKSKNFEDLIRIEKLLYGRNEYFRKQIQQNYIEDDHIPFHARNVSVLHVISNPFPWQWHTLYDNARNLDGTTIKKLLDIFAVFVAEYLHLDIS